MTEDSRPLSAIVKDDGVIGSCPSSTSGFKRSASPSCDSELASEGSRKRLKENASNVDDNPCNPLVVNCNLVEELAAELQCGCCSELVYRPVLVMPCQHFFCGSCCYLWIRNGGTNCPACRGVSDSVTPFRSLQTMLDALLRAAPYKVRTDRERKQADEVYSGQILRIPRPREASPGPDLSQSVDLARPCPYCHDNQMGFICPYPIPDPASDPTHAWRLENGSPPGHAHCGHCENLLALRAPTTSKCDLCQVSFCGINVQGRCVAFPLLSQHPHNMSDISDLIQSSEVYECFDGNTVEVEIMFDYLTAQRLTPRYIYREIVTHIQSQPRGFQPLIELDLFEGIHAVAAGMDPDPAAPRTRICRVCAAEVLLYGLKEWWIRERQKGFLEENVTNRKDCPAGGACIHQKSLAHAKEFNHIIPSKSGESSQQGALDTSNLATSGPADAVTSSSANPQEIPHVPDVATPFVIDVDPAGVATPPGFEPDLVDNEHFDGIAEALDAFS